jgi:hypothetical protein
MFEDCSKLKTIIVGEGWKLENTLRPVSMFRGCTSLVGGSGTVYDRNNISTKYAHVDDPDDPGYFTAAKVNVWGDANDDGTVDMSDVVLIMQSLANPNRYGINGTDEHHITGKGQTNADVSRGSDYEANGITGEDALDIQKYLLGITSSLVPNMP